MSDPEIRREISDTKGRYVIDHPGGATSELTYSILSPQMVIADHTGVADGLEGQGYARLLLDALLADARAEGFRIVPLCPYVMMERRKHPEWAELFDR